MTQSLRCPLGSGSSAPPGEPGRLPTDRRRLLHVAAEASRRSATPGSTAPEVHAWVDKLATKEKDELITSLVVDADHAQIAELLQRFLKERATDGGGPASTGRTVASFFSGRGLHDGGRAHRTEKRAKEKARREREAAIAGRSTSTASSAARPSCDRGRRPRRHQAAQELRPAVKILVDLRDLPLAARRRLRARIAALRQAQAKKPSFIERLQEGGAIVQVSMRPPRPSLHVNLPNP